MKLVIRKQLLYSLIVPYILIVGVVLTGYLYIYNVSANQILDSYYKLNERSLEKLVREIDYEVKDISDFAIELGEREEVRKLAAISLPLDKFERYEIAMSLKKMKSILNSNHFIDAQYIYFEKGDFIVSNGYYYEEEKIIYDEFHGEKETYEEWLGAFRGNYLTPQIKRIGGKIAYIKTVPLEGNCNIVIFVNEKRLETLLKDYEELQQAQLCITNKEGQSLRTKSGIVQTQKEEGIKEVKFGNEKYVEIVKKATEVELLYHAVIPKSVFTKQTKQILILEIILVLLFISLLIAGLYLIQKNYTTIIRLIKKFAVYAHVDEKKVEKQHAGTEFEYIESIMDSLSTDVHKQKELVLENIMGRALNNMIDTDLENSLQKYEDLLVSNQFLIGVMKLDREDYEDGKEKKFDAFIILNVTSEVLESYAKVYLIAFNGSYALIINPGQELQEESMPAIIQELQRGKDFLENKMDLKYTLSISGICVGIRQFSSAYNEAVKGIEYNVIRGKREIIDCTKLYGQEAEYQYSTEMEYQLIGYIKTGDTQKALLTIDYLFDVNFSQNQLSVEGMEGFLFDLYSTLMKIAKEKGITIGKLTSKSLKNIQSLEVMKQMMEDAVVKICTYIEEKKHVIVGEQSNLIIEYIHENYSDINLNVASIAEVFGFNSSYVSRMFKEQTGGNLLTYINSYRIKQVKKLLVETDLTLTEIAVKVGFINSTAIIRTFRKYEGMTPIQYRNICSSLGDV